MSEEILKTNEGVAKSPNAVLDQLSKTQLQTENVVAPAPKATETPKTVVSSQTQVVLDQKAKDEAELVALNLESARLENMLKKANLVDMEERLAERELKRANIRQEAHTKGATLRSIANDKAKQQSKCNHKKGGNGANGIVGGKGDSPDYAILTHTFANGDVWVKCLRCHKTWKPPVESDFTVNGVLNQSQFDVATERYKLALEFPTKNTPSSGVQFSYSDGGAFYRENTKQVQMG